MFSRDKTIRQERVWRRAVVKYPRLHVVRANRLTSAAATGTEGRGWGRPGEDGLDLWLRQEREHLVA